MKICRSSWINVSRF